MDNARTSLIRDQKSFGPIVSRGFSETCEVSTFSFFLALFERSFRRRYHFPRKNPWYLIAETSIRKLLKKVSERGKLCSKIENFVETFLKTCSIKEGQKGGLLLGTRCVLQMGKVLTENFFFSHEKNIHFSRWVKIEILIRSHAQKTSKICEAQAKKKGFSIFLYDRFRC